VSWLRKLLEFANGEHDGDMLVEFAFEGMVAVPSATRRTQETRKPVQLKIENGCGTASTSSYAMAFGNSNPRKLTLRSLGAAGLWLTFRIRALAQLGISSLKSPNDRRSASRMRLVGDLFIRQNHSEYWGQNAPR